MYRNGFSALELRCSGADYLMLGQYESALEHLSKSQQYEPDNTLTLRLLADACYMHNQHNNALRNLSRLLQIKPNDTIAFRIAEELFDIEHASSKQQPWQNH